MKARFCDTCGELYPKGLLEKKIQITGLSSETLAFDLCNDCQTKLDNTLYPEEKEEPKEEVQEETKKEVTPEVKQ